MNAIDFAGLYEYVYSIDKGQQMDQEKYADGIDESEFESIITKYFPVTIPELHKIDAYMSAEHRYKWKRLSCVNYVPNEFGCSIPYIVKSTDNGDGTITFRINSVSDLVQEDDMFTNDLTVRISGNEIKYLGNKIVYDGGGSLPVYRFRN